MHEGLTIEEGHYTIYRKQSSKWALLDDREPTVAESVEPSQVQDSSEHGQSTMLLLKKRQSSA